MPNQTIFITGATSGFGQAAARLFAKNGCNVIATGRRKERLEKLQRDLGEQIHPIQLDVTDRKAVEKSIMNLPREFSEIDVLINNAGGALGLEPAWEANLDDWEQMVDANIKGVMTCTRAILPGMVARDRGHIFNLGSIAGNYYYPGANIYGATKAFVKQFSMNLRADLLGKNIRVTNIEPGLADTEFSVVRFKGDKKKADAVYHGMQPLTAEDIANTIWWCFSQPAHVNVNFIELMPTMQAFAPLAVARKN